MLRALDRTTILKMIGGAALLFGAVALLGSLFRHPLTVFASAFVERFGAAGLALGMLVSDSSPFPIAHEPLLFFAHVGGMPFWEIVLIGGTASMGAGPLGYLGGRTLGRGPRIGGWLARIGLAPLMARNGPLLIALAAITPIPYAASTWLAGATGVPILPFLAACTLRYLKVGLYLWLIILGWRF